MLAIGHGMPCPYPARTGAYSLQRALFPNSVLADLYHRDITGNLRELM